MDTRTGRLGEVPFTALGPGLADRYRIERELGTGGMATVYLAHDERHQRGVALKVLKPDLAAVIGAERFLNEIKTTANLQHPHILPLHDSGEANGTVWYVMPLVEGESLRDRLQRETQLPIDEALTITREVASALDYAHRHGVIHRDIKPENILLHDGRAVVADFGIALAMSRTEGGARLTETGMSLGTPHYMSPEQALGERSVDARTDVYALGVVLYEMLVGEPPFTGPTVQAIVAKVMSAPAAPISALRPSVPPSVEAAVMRALAKVPADRFRSAAEFAAALRSGEGLSRDPLPNVATSAHPAASTTIGIARFAPWIVAAGAAILAAVLAIRPGPAPDTRVTAAVLPLALRTPMDLPLNEVGPLVSIAPDGTFLVFVGPDPEVAGVTALWRRSLDRLDASVIAGTRGAQRPRVMPDGKTVQFFKRASGDQGNARFEIALSGGVPTSAPFSVEITRLRDGRALMFADSGVNGFRVGKPDDAGPRVLRPGAGEVLARAIDVSRDGRWVARARRTGQADSVILRTPEPGTLHVLAAGVSPTFLEDDLLAFRAPDGTLQVGRLKADRSGFVSPPVAMVPNVSLAGDGNAVYSVGDDGTLIYTTGGAAAQSRLTWVTPAGERPVPNVDSRVFGGVMLAPDARRAAVSVGALAGGGDVWVAELENGTFNPLTSDGVSSRPFWLRDNRTVTYLHTTVGLLMIERTARDFAVASRRAIDTSAPADSIPGPWPTGMIDELVWSPDERYVAMRTRPRGGAAQRDIVVRRVGSDSLVRFAAEPGVQERGPRFSPDGKWLLYVSNRSGRDEVYAESFPGGGNRVQLSLDGGREGTWARDGSRVFYRGPDGWMMAARITHGTTLTVAARDRLFDASPYLANQFLVMYDVAADGRFLMLKLDPQPARTDVILIRNWVQSVTARLGGT